MTKFIAPKARTLNMEEKRTNAPAEVKALLTLNLNAKKEVARTASELDRHGYSAGSYGAETDKLKVGYSPKPKPLADFDAQTAKSEAALGGTVQRLGVWGPGAIRRSLSF